MHQGRLAESDEWLARSQRASFEQIESPGHRSAALVARGDLAVEIGDDPRRRWDLFRKAAELLQDVRF